MPSTFNAYVFWLLGICTLFPATLVAHATSKLLGYGNHHMKFQYRKRLHMHMNKCGNKDLKHETQLSAFDLNAYSCVTDGDRCRKLLLCQVLHRAFSVCDALCSSFLSHSSVIYFLFRYEPVSIMSLANWTLCDSKLAKMIEFNTTYLHLKQKLFMSLYHKYWEL